MSSLGINICGREGEEAGLGRGKRWAVMQAQWLLSQPHRALQMEVVLQSCPELDWDGWGFMLPHKSVIRCVPPWKEVWPLGEGSLWSWGHLWRGWLLKTLCRYYSQQLSNRFCIEGRSGWYITVATTTHCKVAFQKPTKSLLPRLAMNPSLESLTDLPWSSSYMNFPSTWHCWSTSLASKPPFTSAVVHFYFSETPSKSSLYFPQWTIQL